MCFFVVLVPFGLFQVCSGSASLRPRTSRCVSPPADVCARRAEPGFSTSVPARAPRAPPPRPPCRPRACSGARAACLRRARGGGDAPAGAGAWAGARRGAARGRGGRAARRPRDRGLQWRGWRGPR